MQNTDRSVSALWRLRRRAALSLMAVLLAGLAAFPAAAQSTDVLDGANAVGVGLYSEINTDEVLQLGAYTAFSIAGIMDVGGFFAREAETVAGRQGTNTSLGFVYNIMPVRQQPGVPLSLQLRLTYGLTLVDRDLVVAELTERFENIDDAPFNVDNVDSTRTSYTLGFGIMHDIRAGEPVSFRVGADLAYRVKRSTYSAVFTELDDDDENGDGSEESAGFRDSTLYFGPSGGVTLRIPDGPVVSFAARVLFDEDRNVLVRPELNMVLMQYQ